MKKIFNIIVLLCICVFSFSCKLLEVETIDYEKQFTLTVDSDILPYLKYDTLLDFTLNYDKVITAGKMRTGEFELALYANDDYYVSSVIEKLINEYDKKDRVSYKLISTDNDAETWMNIKENGEFTKEYIKVKDEKIYNEIVYISLENGLQLSINYARFKDFENNVYYRWQKTEGIRFILHYPLMVYKDLTTNSNALVVMPLPNGVIYYFDSTTKNINEVVKNDKYLSEDYYIFEYNSEIKNYKQDVIDYYLNDCKGTIKDDIITCSFMGNNFTIELYEDSFKVSIKN